MEQREISSRHHYLIVLGEFFFFLYAVYIKYHPRQRKKILSCDLREGGEKVEQKFTHRLHYAGWVGGWNKIVCLLTVSSCMELFPSLLMPNIQVESPVWEAGEQESSEEVSLSCEKKDCRCLLCIIYDILGYFLSALRWWVSNESQPPPLRFSLFWCVLCVLRHPPQLPRTINDAHSAPPSNLFFFFAILYNNKYRRESYFKCWRAHDVDGSARV